MWKQRGDPRSSFRQTAFAERRTRESRFGSGTQWRQHFSYSQQPSFHRPSRLRTPRKTGQASLPLASCGRIDYFPLLILCTRTRLEVAHPFNVTGPWCIRDTLSRLLESRTGNAHISSLLSRLPQTLSDQRCHRIETTPGVIHLFDLQQMLSQSRKEPGRFLESCIPLKYSLS